MNRAFVSGARFIFVVTLVVASFAAIFARLLFLHVVDHEKLSRIVESNRQAFQVIDARRGDVVDARGEILATTHQVFQIGVDPHAVREEDFAQVAELARLLKLSPAEVDKAFRTKVRTVKGPDGPELRDTRWHRLGAPVTPDTLEKIKRLEIAGVYGNPQYRRLYPSMHLAAHVLGHVNLDDAAVTGVEHSMDFYLRGQDGWREVEKDGRRRELAQFSHREVAPRAGLNVELTLDMVIQHAAEEEVARIVEKYQPQGVTIIVSEPTTGYLLALANHPTYNPNVFWKCELDTQRNRAVTDLYEPGSTFKLVTLAAALEEDVFDLDDSFDCTAESATYRGREIRLPSDHKRYEELSLTEVLVKSSNRGSAMIGMALGAEQMFVYGKAFGYGAKTGLGLTGEHRGLYREPARWDGLTISRLPIGYAMAATPLQVHMATSTLANGGVLMQPQAVQRVFDDAGETVLRFDPVAKRRAISTETADQVSEMLRQVCAPGGTAKEAYLEGYEMAGKTGTTKKIVDGQYSNRHHIGSFSGYFPASAPQLVITVVVDEPQLEGYGYGGVVAAPSFRRLAYHTINYLGIPPVNPARVVMRDFN
ncbi:MAG: penicillin-binding protein 2 [Verrucomicrobiota bacterium]